VIHEPTEPRWRRTAEATGRRAKEVGALSLALLLAACSSGGGPSQDEGKACSQRADCIEVCATVCNGIDAGATFHCTSVDKALNACLCAFTVDGGVRPLGC
jgi:hypothetical protein